jgi:hypothetical protein
MPICPRFAGAQFGVHQAASPGSNSVPIVGRESEQAEEERFDSFIAPAGLLDEYRPPHPAFPRLSAGLARHAWD